ncbi:hypothetical protein AX15_002099 [Amanita polypyramis BW_CC]|nr:hypothetical protein AX15_002099 [Amanita polypyramis BW_CC]
MTLLDTYTRCSVARPRPLPSLIRELIAPYNFRKLDVMLDNKHMEYLIALPEEYLSSCEELRLHCSPTGACTYRNIPRLGFRKFHNLEALHLQRVNLDVRSMSWHRLRSFSITKTAMRISACWDILRRGSGTLEFCELSVFEDQLMDHMEIIHCPKLRHFGVTFLHGLDRGHQINPFLLRLRLSSLESLSIPAPMLKRVALELSTLTQLQENCNIQLKRLFIGRTINTFDLRDILQCVPSVQQLGLDGKVVLHPDVFRDLSLGTLGRHLDDLGIKIVYGKDIHGFLEMVKRRNASKRIIDENACDDATYSKFVSIRCIADVRLTAPSTIELVREIKEQRVCLTIEPLQERSHWDSDIELEPDGGPDNDTSFME